MAIPIGFDEYPIPNANHGLMFIPNKQYLDVHPNLVVTNHGCRGLQPSLLGL